MTARPAVPEPSPEYVAAVEEALAVVRLAGAPSVAGGDSQPEDPRDAARARRGSLVRAAARGALSGLRTVIALAALAGFGMLGAAVLVDWFAPTAGPSACSQVVLPLVVMAAALAVLGLVGAVVGRRRRGDTS